MGKRGIGSVVLPYFVICVLVLLAAQLTSVCTTAVVHMQPVQREHTIVIDAGHGGIDGGAVSCTGRPESTYNLEIALRLRDLLHLLGFRTCMIRTGDESIYKEGNTIAAKKVSDLKERVRIVNETENAVLVSIHQNIFADSQYHGAQVFYGPKGQSEALAEQLQDAFRQALDRDSRRQIKKADGIYLMQHTDCTGVLVECGFLSNPEEARLLEDGDYQKKICCILGGTLGTFLTK